MYERWIRRGKEYVNIGHKPLIVREGFVEWLETEKGLLWIEKQKEKYPGFVAPLNR
ncbi:conserved hypothetical protein [delta proteobacterium NaphS2]|nr:conserved hypothetical protein [delta proteobacterium NaphS2]